MQMRKISAVIAAVFVVWGVELAATAQQQKKLTVYSGREEKIMAPNSLAATVVNNGSTVVAGVNGLRPMFKSSQDYNLPPYYFLLSALFEN